MKYNNDAFQEFKELVDLLLPAIPELQVKDWSEGSRVNRLVKLRDLENRFYKSPGSNLYDHITNRSTSRYLMKEVDRVYIERVAKEYHLLDVNSGFGARCYNYFTKVYRLRHRNLKEIKRYLRGLSIFKG